MRIITLALMTVALIKPALAQMTMPIEFDEVGQWILKESWLPNPAKSPILKAADGIAQFSITEPQKGMKWLGRVRSFNPMESGFLVIRYRAENLGGADYFIWVFDATKGGHVLVPRDAIRDDGQWHILAVDLWAADVIGSVSSLAIAVSASDRLPASLWLDYILYAEDAPANADRYPKEEKPEMKYREDFNAPDDWHRRLDWLSNPDATATLTSEEGAIVMTVPTAAKGMKWSRRYKESIDLQNARYVAIRYRAENIARHGDYFVWIGSETGGLPQQSAALLALHDVEDDGAWHVHVAPLREHFKVAEMAIQVQADVANARAWIDYVKFTSHRPLIPIADCTHYTKGFSGLRLKEGKFFTVELAETANADVSSRLKTLGLANWFDDAKITIEGIPFALATGDKNVAATPLGKIEPVAIPVGKQAREAYLLMVSLLPPEDFSGMLGGRPFLKFDNPERFVARIKYADGVEDLHFPIRVRSGRYEIIRGVDVYCLTNLRPVTIETIALECRMFNGYMMLAGLTLNTGDPVTPQPHVSSIPPPVVERPIEPQKPKIQVEGTAFTIETSTLRASFSTLRGVTLTSLQDKCLVPQTKQDVKLSSASFFELGVGDRLLTSEQVSVSGLKREGGAVMMEVDARPQAPIAGTLRIAADDTGEVIMTLDIKNVSNRVINPIVNFPTFSGVVLDDVEDTWYFYARQGGVINNLPTHQRAPYSGRYPLQVMGLFNPKLAGGIYLLVHDLDDIYKYYVTNKDDDGVDWRVEYFPREHQPDERIEVAETVVCGNSGDWRAQLSAYQRWAKSWYKPLVPRKDWFRDIYNYRQHYVWSELYDFKTGQYRMMDIAEKDREFFGRIDYLHIFDFGESKKYGRVGDYCHYDEIGGLEKLAAAIAEVEESGVPIGLYIEGYLCDERGLWGREHVAEAHIIKKDGSPLLWAGNSPEHMMCPASSLWQEHLANVYRRVARELKPNGMYIDQHGFGDEWKICWSREHGHPVPWPPIRGERDLGRRIREAVPPQIATLTEETPTDVNSQVQDGALGYSVAHADPQLAPHRVDLFRFVFPDFKVFQLVAYNNFIDGGWARLKFPFFNAEGWWLGNAIPDGFDPAAQEFLRKAFRILHAHREAFRSASPKPLVPTEDPLIYANEFPAQKETVWTLFNASYTTYRGPVLAVKHVDGATYKDLWGDKELNPQINGGRALLSAEIGPREVGCVAQIRSSTSDK